VHFLEEAGGIQRCGTRWQLSLIPRVGIIEYAEPIQAVQHFDRFAAKGALAVVEDHGAPCCDAGIHPSFETLYALLFVRCPPFANSGPFTLW
jgi:hypothetical protein